MANLATITPTIGEGDLNQIGLHVIQIITERTLRGDGVDGPLAPYSTKPFAMPAGALTQKARKGLGREGLHYFKQKTGALWVIVTGGYAAYKQAAYARGGDVNLWAKGHMLGDMAVLSVDTTTNTVRIGFNSQRESEKASYHQELGAGKSKAIRKFLGLRDEEKAEVIAGAATRIIIKT